MTITNNVNYMNENRAKRQKRRTVNTLKQRTHDEEEAGKKND